MSISLDFLANPETDNLTIGGTHHPMKLSILSIHTWIVISQRIDGSMSFNRNWTDYKEGFGTFDNASSNFWLGNEKLYVMTRHHEHRLRVEFQFKETGDWYSAEYNSFEVDDELEGYMLHVGGFSGDVGDSLNGSAHGGAHKMKFSTPDRDNDLDPNRNCAEEYLCGWWMNHCFTANLNGLYDSGIHWDSVNGNLNTLPSVSIREVRMMISREENNYP